jgi:hypothetical protein
MLSVKGVGKVLAAMLLVYSHGFNRLTDSRKPACYSGWTLNWFVILSRGYCIVCCHVIKKIAHNVLRLGVVADLYHK